MRRPPNPSRRPPTFKILVVVVLTIFFSHLLHWIQLNTVKKNYGFAQYMPVVQQYQACLGLKMIFLWEKMKEKYIFSKKKNKNIK